MNKKKADHGIDNFMHGEAIKQRPDLFPTKKPALDALKKVTKETSPGIWGAIKNKVLKGVLKVR